MDLPACVTRFVAVVVLQQPWLNAIQPFLGANRELVRLGHFFQKQQKSFLKLYIFLSMTNGGVPLSRQ